MILTRKNRSGYVTAYMECKLKTKYKPDDFIYISDFWVHDRYAHMGNALYFAKRACAKFITAQYVYFARHKYNERLSVYEIIRSKGEIKFKKRRIDYGQ